MPIFPFVPLAALALAGLSDSQQPEVVSLALRARRRDRPGHGWYLVLAKGPGDLILVSGHATRKEGGEAQRRMIEDWGHILDAGEDDTWNIFPLVIDRKRLVEAGIYPEEASQMGPGGRHWMHGNMVRASPEDLLDAAKLAIQNVSILTGQGPFKYLDKAVVRPSENLSAEEWAPEAKVVIFREYGLPDHMGWYLKVEAELRRMGHELSHESINAGVYALYVDTAPALPAPAEDMTWDSRVVDVLESGICYSDEDDPAVLYHATPAAQVARILEEGLRPGTGGNFNLPAHAAGKVFVSAGYENAVRWQGFLAEQLGEDIAILQIRISNELGAQLRVDDLALGEGDPCSFYVEAQVTPAHLSVVDSGEGTASL
jgi:hypothetical protein